MRICTLFIVAAVCLAAGPAQQNTLFPEAVSATAPPQAAAPDLLKMLAQITGGSRSPAAGAPDEAGADPGAAAGAGAVSRTDTGLLDVHVRDMELSTVLEMLSYQASANIVTSTSVSGRVSANLYGVSLEQALEAILTPNKYRFHASGGTVFVGNAEEIDVLLPPPVARVYKLKYIRPAEAAAAVKGLLGAEAKVVEGDGAGGKQGSGGSSSSSGGASGTFKADMNGAGADYIIVTDRPDRLAAVAKLLAQIDQRPRQVLVESTVLRASLNESNQFGVDFTMLGGVDFQNVNSTSNAAADIKTGALPPAKMENTDFNINTNFAGNITGGGFTFGLIKNNIGVFVRALEEVTDVVVVANPKIVALNKQEGEVIVGRRDGYITTTVTETAAVQKVEFLETGTQIRFRPIINEDGSVRLVVHPKDSNGGLTAANLPFEETTEAQADVLLNDGNTILIGGLFRERSVSSRSQIPGLGNIPWGGLLFGSRNDQTVREEVIILLTVHVIKETPEEQAQAIQLLNDVEHIRVGSRTGLLAFGRERLAQAHYHEALRQLEAGHPDLALLNVRMTLNNQPHHVHALKLLDRLLGERLWDDEGSRMRTFVWDVLQMEQPALPPRREAPYGRPYVDTTPPPPPSPDLDCEQHDDVEPN